MKIAITVRGSYTGSNQFDYKISFLLNKGFELINSTSFNDQGLEMSAILVGKIDNDTDVELIRRTLSIEMNESLKKEKYEYYRIDKQTDEMYKNKEEYKKMKIAKIKEVAKEIDEFLNKNDRFLSIDKEEIRKYKYSSFNSFLVYGDKEIRSRMIDEDKLKEFKKLLKKAKNTKNLNPNSLLPPSNF